MALGIAYIILGVCLAWFGCYVLVDRTTILEKPVMPETPVERTYTQSEMNWATTIASLMGQCSIMKHLPSVKFDQYQEQGLRYQKELETKYGVKSWLFEEKKEEEGEKK